MMSKNKESKRQDKNIKIIRAFPTWASTLIVVISILEIGFIIALFTLFLLCKIPPNFFEKAAESSLLASGIAIIGVAIAVWAGLNIANAIERKDLENLNDKIGRLIIQSNKVKRATDENITETERVSKQAQNISEKLESVEKKEASVDKATLLNQMYNTVQDLSTRILIEKIRKIETLTDIQFLSLVEIERIFSSVYHLHRNDYVYDAGLLQEANHGVLLCEQLLLNKNLDDVVQQYLEYRIAEFNFYSGYCCDFSERKKYFDRAVKIYLKIHDFFGAKLPAYEENQLFPHIKYKECSKDFLEISAYFCNSIGEAYSKIIQIKEKILCTETEIKEYGQKAIFYCAYAAHWSNKETYWRNLGCAIERHYGVTNEIFDELYKVYNTALEIRATQSAFKVLLSASDKFINNYLGIKSVDISKGREIPLSDASYQEIWNALEQPVQQKILKELSILSEKSTFAKMIYPSIDVGYTYNCIFHRDMCLINGKNNSVAKKHLEKAKDDLKVLSIINPGGALTKILRDDLESLL